MGRVELDDNFPDHPKVCGLSDRAYRAYVHGLCYSARHLTDGRIPPAAQTGGANVRDELVAARLWALDDDDTVVVHDYLEWNPSRAQIEAKRAKDSERKRNGIPKESERIPDGKKAKKAPAKPRKPRPRDEVWDALVTIFGDVVSGTMAHSKRNVVVRDLKLNGATGASVTAAYRKYTKLFDHATPTDTALAKHYPQLVNGTVYSPRHKEPVAEMVPPDLLGGL